MTILVTTAGNERLFSVLKPVKICVTPRTPLESLQTYLVRKGLDAPLLLKNSTPLSAFQFSFPHHGQSTGASYSYSTAPPHKIIHC